MPNRFEWKTASRSNWSNDEQPPDAAQKIGIGALQRIADALEKIAELLEYLDPKVRRDRLAEVREESEREKRRPAANEIQSKVWGLIDGDLAAYCQSPTEKRAVTRICRAAGQHYRRRVLSGYDPPSDSEIALTAEFILVTDIPEA